MCPRQEMVDFILRPEPGTEKKVLDVGQSQSPVVIMRKPTNTCLLLTFRLWEWYLVSTSPFGIFALTYSGCFFSGP